LALMDHSSSNSRRARPWIIPVALLVLGLADLVLRGWGGDARLFLLTLVMAATLVVDWRAGAIALAVSVVCLVVSALAGRGVLLPSVALSLPQVLIGLGVFLGTGGVAVAVGHALSAEAAEQMDRARQSTRSLAKSVLDARIAGLQETNDSLLQRVLFLEASLSVAQQLATVFDVNTLLNRAAELIAEQFGFAEVMIYTVDAGEEWATLQSASTVFGKEAVLQGLRVRRGSRGLVGTAMAHRRAQVRGLGDRDAGAEGTSDPDPDGRLPAATLPLMVQDQLLGVLDLTVPADQPAIGDELGALEGLADHLALALNNARRLGNETAVLEATSPVYRAANALATARTEQEVYDVLLSTLSPYGSSRTLIVRAHGEGQLTLVRDADGSGVDTDERDLALLTPPGLIDIVILGLALDVPLWIPDLMGLDETLNPELRSALVNLAEGCLDQALAFVPVHMEGGATVGGLLVLYRTAHRFVPVERRLHQLLSELGGAALDRSRLLAEASARLDREKALMSVGDRLRSSLDPDVIMRRALQELATVLEADVATIEIAPEADGRQAPVGQTTASAYRTPFELGGSALGRSDTGPERRDA